MRTVTRYSSCSDTSISLVSDKGAGGGVEGTTTMTAPGLPPEIWNHILLWGGPLALCPSVRVDALNVAVIRIQRIVRRLLVFFPFAS